MLFSYFSNVHKFFKLIIATVMQPYNTALAGVSSVATFTFTLDFAEGIESLKNSPVL